MAAKLAAFLATGIVLFAITTSAQASTYRVGDQVELNAIDDYWQSCTVVDPGSPLRVMRLRCEPFEAEGYSRNGGMFVESFDSRAVRRATGNNPVAPPPPAVVAPPMQQPAAPAPAGRFRMGEQVELNAIDDHWQRCAVLDPGSAFRVMRLQCESYSQDGYSRHGGIFVESFDSKAVRRPARGPE